MKYKLKRGIEAFLDFCRSRKSISRMLIGLIVIIMIIQLAGSINMNKKFILDKSGYITAIINNDKGNVSIPVKIRAVKGKTEAEKEEILYFKSEKNRQKNMTSKRSEKSELEGDIEDARRHVVETKEEIIYLPSHTESGAKLIWKKNRKYVNPLIPFLYPVVMYVLYQSQLNNQKEKIKIKRDEIIRFLPCFSSQLLLLLNSGLIFTDAVQKIVEGYSIKNEKDINYLERTVLDIQIKSKETGLTLIKVFEQFSRDMKLKEFSRFVGIISDNEYRGVSLAEKLQKESDILWDQRKKKAEESGRLAETKLAFPLALLLIVLIIVTAAPAILQI